MVSLATGSEKDIPGSVRFPHKIGRRLTIALGFLIAVVLLVGGFSLYLANSISETTDRVKTITGRIEHIDHLHFIMHHLIGQVSLTVYDGIDHEPDRIERNITDLEEHIRHYKALEDEAPLLKAGLQYPLHRAVEKEFALLIHLARKIAGSITPATQPSREDLAEIKSLDIGLRQQFVKINSLHQKDIARELQVSRSKMNLIKVIYLAFLVIGILGLVGWSWTMSKTIVSPIRNLASAADGVARGNLDRRVPVTSKDEIGQLSHSFNFMAERIRDHEKKLKGVAALEERERLAQELHDSLAQDVALLHLKIAEAEKHLSTDGASSVGETLKEMRKISEGAFGDIRQAIFGLRTMVSKDLGLIPTLTEYLHDFSEQRGLAVDLKVDGSGVPEISSQQEIQVIRIIHEALTNVFKHAGATRSEVRFEREGKVSKVIIEDNGKGFLLEEAMEKGLHFGLKTMRERARAVNGDLKVETEPGKGTRVVVLLPLEEKLYG